MTSLFPEYNPQQMYQGAFWPQGGDERSYRAMMVEVAIRQDSVPKIKEAIASGWLNKDSRCFDGATVRHYCTGQRKAVKIAEYLEKQGWPA